MASSMLAVAAAAAVTASASSPTHASPNACKDNEALSSSLHSCANDPDFAVICAFFQKFFKELGIELPNFKHLQEWMSNTDEVSDQLRDLHIKLLRKTRKTVHEKSWESALSKFCFTYSSQDAWEVERFGYKQSSLKVKLRILRALLESQFERNGKFRSKILTINADSLRSQPIGRDRLGHSYWLTQDEDCNLRIYQEHLDEEIWQVVARNREELVKLIARLRGNEVVLPSSDIGLVDEDTSSSNSYTAKVKKPPPPEEKDDSQEEGSKVPNLRIKLNTTGAILQVEDAGKGEEELALEEDANLKRKRAKARSHQNINLDSPNTPLEEVKRLQQTWPFVSRSSEMSEDMSDLKKVRPSLLDVNRTKKLSKYEKAKSEDEEEELSVEEEDIDSVAAEEDENELKDIEEYDDDETDEVGEAIEDPLIVVSGEGAGMDCDLGNLSAMSMEEKEFLKMCEVTEFQRELELGNDNVIEEDVFYVIGEGQGEQCLVGNTKNDAASSERTPPPTEPKATFFFGEPGCLKLTPMKQIPKVDISSEDTSEIPADGRMSSIRTDKGSFEDSVENVETCSKEMQSKKTHFEEKNTPKTARKEEWYQDKLEGSENLTSNGNNVSYNKNVEKKRAIDEVIKTKNCVEEVKTDGELELLKLETTGQQNNKTANDCNINKNEESYSKIEYDIPQEHDVGPTEIKSENMRDLLCIVPPAFENEESEDETNSTKVTDNNCEIQSVPAILLADGTSQTTAENTADEKIGEVEKTNNPQTNIHNVSNVSILSRKRRLTDNSPIHKTTRPSSSESDVEFHSENHEDDGKHDALDIGGKRLKMRPKITYTGLRKKVEARKFAIEETTSSSSEDDARRRLKINPTKKQVDKSIKISMSIDDCEKQVDKQKKEMFKQPSKQRDEEQSNETLPETSKASITEKVSTVSTALSLLGSVTVKHKPTLAEIIEKKLKKTAEKTSFPTVSEAGAEDEKTAIFSSKKLPITKPLKKNLLTQIRQEESDEEAIPRKRTTSDTAVTATADSLKESQLPDSTKTHNISAALCPEHEGKAQELQHKGHNSEEQKKKDTFATEEKKEIKCEKIHVERQHEHSLAVEETSKQLAVVSRRSGRRGGAIVMHTELPQPKRTRGATRGAQKKDDIKVEESEQVSSDGTTNKLKKIDPALDIKEVQQKVRDNSKSVAIEKLKKPNSEPIPQTPTSSLISKSTRDGSGRGRGGRKKREVDTTNIIDTTDAETPVRQSRRIAQQKIREEAERRKLEEIALRTMKLELKKKKKAEKQADPTVVEPSEHSSSEESEVELKKKAKKKCPGKDGWSSGSEEQEEPEEDDEPPHYETDPGSPLFKSDHEFSPESDLEDETQVVPMKRARTARKEDAEADENGDEEACQKCGKSDHPEWILLCDSCDKGYHCSCLSPVLFYIPEGDWFCPPCQQDQLIAALEQQLKEFDECVERKRLQEEEVKRMAAEAERVEQERVEAEKKRKELKKKKRQDRRRGDRGHIDGKGESDTDESCSAESDETSSKCSNSVSSEDEKLIKKSKTDDYGGGGKRRRGDGRSRRRAATRGVANRRRRRSISESGGNSLAHSVTTKSSSSSGTDSDDEPIYKLRKRRQINVSYRLNEYDDLINSALKKEMDELAGAGNLGRGKDITTIIEAEREEKARQKQLEKTELEAGSSRDEKLNSVADDETAERKGAINSEDGDKLLKRKNKSKSIMKKKSRKLTTLDITSEEDDASDEDFKTSSFEEDEDDDTSITVSTNSDTSLEVYRRRNKVAKKQRKAARRTARERLKDRKFVVDESDEEEEIERPKLKKKREDDSDYTESETESDASENLEDVDSADLCDDTTSDESDGAWYPSKRKKQHKSNVGIPRKSPKLKKCQPKKTKRVEYSDDDVSETEEEDDDDNCGGKGSGKQPRSQPLKTSNAGKGKGKGKSSVAKKKKKQSGDESFSDSEDSTRRTRGRRYAYLEDFDDDSSDGGIKPGVKRPDTPPEEREKFIQKQEEIKRMLAAKNAEGAKLAATPRLTPLKSTGDKEKRSPVKTADSLSTVPLSVIRQAKVLDADYLQRKGEPITDLENVDGVDEFDDADLPDDFPDDMDEDTIVRMVEEEEEFGVATVARDLPAPDEVLRNPLKGKTKEIATPNDVAIAVTAATAPIVEKSVLISPSLIALSQMPGATTTASGLQEPMRKRLPIPTIHPPLLRHQFQPHTSAISSAQMMQRNPTAPPTHLLQNALSAPLGQPLNRSSFTHQRLLLGEPTGHSLSSHLIAAREALSTSQSLSTATTVVDTTNESDTKPRGRRKKITPLRDPLQKQQAAAAATAAAAHSDKSELASSTNSVIKSPPLSLSHAGEMYKSPSSGGTGVQLSVITRMPHLSTQTHSIAVSRPGSSVYSAAEVPRFYGPPQQITQSVSPSMGSSRQQASAQRHRGSTQMVGLPSPHSSMRASYGLPPPLRGGAAPSNHSPSPLSTVVTSGGRSSYGAGDHRVPPPLGTVYGAPPSARHPTPHLSPYRPTMYGNPNCTPRSTLAANLRAVPLSSSVEYASGVRTYTPYGYYPPPPPLTTQHQPITTDSTTPQPTLSDMSSSKTSPSLHFGAVPNSVIVSAPIAAVTGTTDSNTVVRSIVKSPKPDVTVTTSSTTSPPLLSVAVVTTKNTVEQRKKLTTLEAYPVSNIKSPLAIAGESSGSHSSPGLQTDAADDSSSTPAASAVVVTSAGTEQEASEFSGLVSYFSSQHDDYNT